MKVASRFILAILVVGLIGWAGCDDQRTGEDTTVTPDAQPAGERTTPTETTPPPDMGTGTDTTGTDTTVPPTTGPADTGTGPGETPR